MPYINLRPVPQKTKRAMPRWIIALVLALFAGFIAAFFILSKKSTNNTETGQTQLLSSQERVGTSVNSLGVLILGYGGAGHPGGFLADAIQVLHLDFDRKKATLISIPRDLWVKFPDGSENKINSSLVHFSKNSKDVVFSGAPDTKQFLGNLLGVNIDYFVGVDFVGFQRAIGLHLKNLEVDVKEPLVDPWYPVSGRELDPCGMTPEEIAEVSRKYSGFELEKQFPCRYEKLDFKAGKQKMLAADALKYVRSRHGSGQGDMSRNIRQQEVLLAVKNKIISLEFISDIPGFYSDISKNIKTDLDLEAVKKLAPNIKNASSFNLEYINLGENNVLTTGNAGSTALVRPKEGLHKWGALQGFIAENLKY